MAALFITRVSEEDFLGIREDWNLLLGKSMTNEVFLTWEWIYSWWNVFKDKNKNLYILIGRNENNEIVGIAPFYIEIRKILGLEFRKIIRFCSSFETYPDHLDLICAKECKGLFLEAVFKYLAENHEDWNVIKLSGVGENSIIKKYLSNEMDIRNKFVIDILEESKCPYLGVSGKFEDYLKAFSSKKRYTLLKKRKLLLKNGNVEYRVVDFTEDPEKYIKELFRLHAERAKRKGTNTTFFGDSIYDFHKKFITSMLGLHKIVIAFLYEDSEPLASYYCIKHNSKYYYYQAGVSLEGEKKSAGSVLLSLMIEKAFNEGCREFDFLRGNEEYKHFWTQQFRYNYSIVVRKNNLGGNISREVDRLFRSLKTVKRLIR